MVKSFQEEKKDLQEVNASASVCSMSRGKLDGLARGLDPDGSVEENG